VDDASTDGTLELAKRLESNHPAVRLITRSENGGAAACRNMVIAEARGEYIAFFDDDDVSDPLRIERQLKRLLGYEAALGRRALVACHTARRQLYPDGTNRVEPAMGEGLEVPAPNGIAVARRILAGAPLRGAYGSCASCSYMSRTSTLRQIGGFDPLFRRSQDTELCVRLAKAGAHFVGIDEPLVTQTMTRSSDKSIERERHYWLALLDKHRDVFASHAEYDACRRWVELRHDWLAARHGAFWRRALNLAATRPLFTGRRLWLSLRNLPGNTAFSRFHLGR
jgi:GT2 family glycosyltransferase